ncbi:DUF305 domain-containing protein [Hymenobacter sp. 15J16-1T3B]|uniref:DUF305 domain-containing protein n=1 Tax=Hymenobacter sp. 15J16-1T3B TaxID=2886941 RepID=UPI001D12F4F9|nr:DUF305 domain-containing protein [Hymenobacter sp. 15J16-1T3B]MCC3159743.1 DUF305 domain-containing protein [Hymenobacter sp. 15J16-1T3B]
MPQHTYRTFALMLAASFVVMYTVMFLNVDRLAHIYLSLTRTYMTLLMVAPMAVLMLVFMPHMYPDKARNTLILVSSALVFVLALLGLRTQALVTDEQYMQAMIPHHSSAIMVSQQARLKDPELRQLAQDIIRAQEREIAQMERIRARLKH